MLAFLARHGFDPLADPRLVAAPLRKLVSAHAPCGARGFTRRLSARSCSLDGERDSSTLVVSLFSTSLREVVQPCSSLFS